MAPPRLPRPISPSAAAVRAPGSQTITLAGDSADAVRARARALGFDGVSTFLVPDRRSGRPSPALLWSTWGDAWLAAYRDAGWIDVDPRVEATARRELPCQWDAGSLVCRGRRGRFLDAADRAGIRSGLAIPVSVPGGLAIVSLDAGLTPVTRARRRAILERLGEAMGLAHAVHARRHPALSLPGTIAARPPGELSARERSCLALSARGLTSRDIAGRLGIASRTVDFHFCNVLAKLAAVNRHEAIAKAAAQGLIAP